MARCASSCLLALLLAAAAFGAEPAATDAQASAEVAAAQGASEAPDAEDADDIDAAMAEEIRVAEETAAALPADSNEPFVPSVQISEDLSVSFPVDI